MNPPPDPEAPSDPTPLAERRGRGARLLIPIVGGVVAVGLGTALALSVFRQDPADEAPPPAAEGGLKIELGNTQGGDRIDPARPLRCFVEGKFVGELVVADCAKRNGVAAQNLDVGLDAAGELAAVVAMPEPATEPLVAEPETPAPVTVAGADGSRADPPDSSPGGGPTGECMRHASGEWRTLGDALGLDTCVQILFTGRCEPPGSATYGRWNGQTLRLVTGRVEIAPNGADFHTFALQDAQCMLP